MICIGDYRVEFHSNTMVVSAKRLVRRCQGTTAEIDSRFSLHGTLTPPWESKKKRREDSPTP
jgi:hypothetical protein